MAKRFRVTADNVDLILLREQAGYLAEISEYLDVQRPVITDEWHEAIEGILNLLAELDYNAN